MATLMNADSMMNGDRSMQDVSEEDNVTRTETTIRKSDFQYMSPHSDGGSFHLACSI